MSITTNDLRKVALGLALSTFLSNFYRTTFSLLELEGLVAYIYDHEYEIVDWDKFNETKGTDIGTWQPFEDYTGSALFGVIEALSDDILESYKELAVRTDFVTVPRVYEQEIEIGVPVTCGLCKLPLAEHDAKRDERYRTGWVCANAHTEAQLDDRTDEDHVTWFDSKGHEIDCTTVDRTASDSFIWELFAEFEHERTKGTTFTRGPHTGDC